MLTPTLAPNPSSQTKTDSDMLHVRETVNRPVKGIPLRGNTKASEAKIEATAKEFEEHFIAQMMSTMFSTVDTSESLAGSDAEEVYQSMLENEYGKIVARSGGLGIADQVKQIMLQQQELE